MGKGKFNPKSGNGKPTMRGVLSATSLVSTSINNGLVRAGVSYDVVGRIDPAEVKQMGSDTLSARASCNGVDRGMATFYGMVPGQEAVWRAKVPVSSMRPLGNGSIYLGDAIVPRVVGRRDHGYADAIKHVPHK